MSALELGCADYAKLCCSLYSSAKGGALPLSTEDSGFPIVAEDTEAHAFIIHVPCMQTSLLVGGVDVD